MWICDTGNSRFTFQYPVWGGGWKKVLNTPLFYRKKICKSTKITLAK